MVKTIAAALCFSLIAAQAIGSKRDPYEVTVYPRMGLPPLGDQVQNYHITLRLNEPLTEANYCIGVEVTWPDGTRSSHVQDCPPFAEYIAQVRRYTECREQVIVCPKDYTVCEFDCPAPFDLQREWTFDTRRMRHAYGPGRHTVFVKFLLPGGRTMLRSADWHVAGGEER